MSFGQIFAMLMARWRVMLPVFLLTIGTAGLILKLLPKQYEAQAQVVLESQDSLYGGMMRELGGLTYISTQIAIVGSERVARSVVRKLHLTDNADMREDWKTATDGGRGDFEAWIAGLLLKNLTVEPAGKSNILDVTYKAVDPRFATIVANAFVQSYIDTTLELRVNPAKENSTFFDSRAKQQRESLERAQAKLTEAQKQTGITITDERLDVEMARLNALAAQIVAMQAISSESARRQAQANGTTPDQLSDVLNNPIVAGLKADLARQEVSLRQLNSRLGDNHPQVIEAKASIAELRARLAAEIRKVSGSVNVTNTINRQREADVQAQYEEQHQRVLRMKTQRDELAVLQRDVDNAQRSYEAVLNRLNQTSLESQSSRANVSVLTPASEPADYTYPKVIRNMIFATVLGLMLSVGVALLVEFLNRKVRSIEDVSVSLGLPVIGIMPRPDRRRLLGGSRAQPLLARRVLGQLPSPR
jgi:chain length determinant protein EpsF